jgi:O-antigen ligase
VLSSPRRRLLTWSGYALLWVALLLTITRMTIVACLLQTLVLAGVRRSWGLAVGVCAAVVSGFAVVLVLFPGFAAFIWETLTWQSGSSQSHLQDWGEAVDNLIRYPLGAGLGSTDQNAVRFGLTPLAADNQYFKYALELGIPGLLLHVAMLIGMLAVGVRASRTAPSETGRSYGLLVAVTVLGIMLNAMTAAVINSMMLAYVFLWLAGALVTILDQPSTTDAARA